MAAGGDNEHGGCGVDTGPGSCIPASQPPCRLHWDPERDQRHTQRQAAGCSPGDRLGQVRGSQRGPAGPHGDSRAGGLSWRPPGEPSTPPGSTHTGCHWLGLGSQGVSILLPPPRLLSSFIPLEPRLHRGPALREPSLLLSLLWLRLVPTAPGFPMGLLLADSELRRAGTGSSSCPSVQPPP